MAAERPGFFERFHVIARLLLDDVHAAEVLHQERGNDFTRRTLIKTLFTYLEGNLYAFKQEILGLERVLAAPLLPTATDSRLILFTDEERAMLEEFTFDLSSGGRARKQTYYPKLLESIKFALDVFHRAVRLESDVNFNCEGWSHLVEGQRIRNRLTHPKSPACLKVTDEDIRIVDTGVRWYEDMSDRLLDRFQRESIYAPRFKQNKNLTHSE